MRFTSVAKIEDIPPGERKRFEVHGERVTVFHIDGEFYAIRDTCPHKNTTPLLRGTLDGLGIRCPNHGYRFDLKTGACDVGAQWNTKVFPVRVQDGTIQIGLDGE